MMCVCGFWAILWLGGVRALGRVHLQSCVSGTCRRRTLWDLWTLCNLPSVFPGFGTITSKLFFEETKRLLNSHRWFGYAPPPPPSSSREWKSYDQRQPAGRGSQHYFSLSLKLIFFIVESFLLLSNWIGFQGTLRIVVYRIHIFWKWVDSSEGERGACSGHLFLLSEECFVCKWSLASVSPLW